MSVKKRDPGGPFASRRQYATPPIADPLELQPHSVLGGVISCLGRPRLSRRSRQGKLHCHFNSTTYREERQAFRFSSTILHVSTQTHQGEQRIVCGTLQRRHLAPARYLILYERFGQIIKSFQTPRSLIFDVPRRLG